MVLSGLLLEWLEGYGLGEFDDWFVGRWGYFYGIFLIFFERDFSIVRFYIEDLTLFKWGVYYWNV